MEEVKLSQTFSGHSHYVACIAFSPDSNYLVCGIYDSFVKIWIKESETKNEFLPNPIQESKEHTYQVNCVSFASSGTMFATGSFDNSIKLWMKQDKHKFIVFNTFIGHTKSINSVFIDLKANLVISGSEDETIRFWNIKKDLTYKELFDPIVSVAYDLNSQGMIACVSNEYIISSSWTDNKPLQKFKHNHRQFVYSLSFSNDGKFIATGSADYSIKIFAVNSENLIQEEAIQTLYSHTFYVYPIAFSPQGNILVSGGYDKTIRIWRKKDDNIMYEEDPIQIFYDHNDTVYCLKFNPDGNIFASGSWDFTVKVWKRDDDLINSISFSLLQNISSQVDIAYSICFNNNSSIIAIGDRDTRIKLWRKEEEQLYKEDPFLLLEGHKLPVCKIVFYKDFLVSGSEDNTIILWIKDPKDENYKLLRKTEGTKPYIFDDKLITISSLNVKIYQFIEKVVSIDVILSKYLTNHNK